MAIIPLLPLFHKFNKSFFDNSLVRDSEPIVKIRWSDNKLKTTAGYYKREKINGIIYSQIVLSQPILKQLSLKEIQSTLCHEMIHAWIDRILKINEVHGLNFLKKMHQINTQQSSFQISVRHNFPVFKKEFKYQGICINCGSKFLYRKRVKNISCKTCCDLFFHGEWSKQCLIKFENLK